MDTRSTPVEWRTLEYCRRVVSESAVRPNWQCNVHGSQTYLSEGVLTKVDRASMAHGIEAFPICRSPHRRTRSQIPMQFKLNHRGNKQILHHYCPHCRPTSNIDQRRLRLPVAQWMFNSHNTLLDDLRNLIDVASNRPYKPSANTRSGPNHRRRLWSGLMLAEWLARHG